MRRAHLLDGPVPSEPTAIPPDTQPKSLWPFIVMALDKIEQISPYYDNSLCKVRFMAPYSYGPMLWLHIVMAAVQGPLRSTYNYGPV